MNKVALTATAAVILGAGLVLALNARADDCVTAEETKAWFEAKYPDALLDGPMKMPPELVKPFLAVTGFPGIDAVANVEVLKNPQSGKVMIIPVNADGCAFSSPAADGLASSPEGGTSLVVPVFVFERYMEQAKEMANGQGA